MASWIPVERLLARVRHGPPRRDELRRLRARFLAAGHRPSREERALARAIATLKRDLADAFGDARACGRCARGAAPPKGRWEGGRCCGTRTENVFTAEEVRALVAAGRRAPRTAPDEDLAGCVLRGPLGCAAEPEDRPTVCLVYACAELKEELRGGEREERIRALRFALAEAFDAYLALIGAPADRRAVPTTLVSR